MNKKTFIVPHDFTPIADNALDHAIRTAEVVTNSDVPFVIVQDKKIKLEGFKNIVVPMDLHKETKQKLAMVSNLATYFNSKVHVVTPDETDEFLQHHVQANIQFAKRFFAERNVEMDSAIVPSSGFDKEVVKYAVSIDADLIAIMNLNRSSFLSAITANYEQYIITNDAKIPTLIINPIEIGGSFHFPSYLV